jgi:glutamyl-Q tRNA(Asp) synthetase
MITRFAPSPTGPLHLGHAYSAILAHDMAHAAGGTFLLRIEDIDRSRARPEWEDLIYEDLRWLGLSWEEPVMRQSGRMAAYADALDRLWAMGLLYPCDCTRRDIAEALSAPQEGAEPMIGPDGPVYPGTCRGPIPRTHLPRGPSPPPRTGAAPGHGTRAARDRTYRIDSPEGGWHAFAGFSETGAGPEGQTGLVEFTPEEAVTGIGDIVLARRDMGTSYHLSVVVDDAAQGVTHVTRGADLFEATKIHVILQRLLGLPTPIYHHHRLIRDEAGKRLAKRDDARAIRTYRADGASPGDIRRLVGL